MDGVCRHAFRDKRILYGDSAGDQRQRLLPVVAAAATTSLAGNTSEFSAWVSTVPVPSLQLALAGANRNQVSLSWANNGGNFLLQQTASLTPPVQWTTVAAAPSLVNGFYVVTAAPTNGSAFYRLTAQ